jgi:hypothetical protein
MITKLKFANGTMSDNYRSRFKVERSDAKRREPTTIQAYSFLLLWVIFVCAVTDGLAAVVLHVW